MKANNFQKILKALQQRAQKTYTFFLILFPKELGKGKRKTSSQTSDNNNPMFSVFEASDESFKSQSPFPM